MRPLRPHSATLKKLLLVGCFVLLMACGADGPNDGRVEGSSSSVDTSSSSSSILASSSSSRHSVQSSSSAQSSASSSIDSGYQPGEFILGMDISYWSEQLDRGASYVDTDGQTKDLLELFKNHGINYIRLRTFVDPWAQYGYASNSRCNGKSQPYNNKDDIIRMAQRIKQAGMGLLLNFHYSDTWADPSKQVIPEAWRGARSIDELAGSVAAYTTDVLEALRAVDVVPDMVQVGNETTPGMLRDIPTADTDCYGNNSVRSTGPNGAASNNNWANLGILLKAGVQAVRHHDANVQVMLHLENTENPEGVIWWVRNALNQGVEFDVLGLSAYEAFQGPASEWRPTLQRLAREFPSLAFAIVEYNTQTRLLNDIMRELPDGRGLGTFFWEPTESGFWGDAIFSRRGTVYTARPQDFATYDQIVEDFGLRKLP